MRITKPFHFYRVMSGVKTFNLQKELDKVLAIRTTVETTEAKLGKKVFRVQRRPIVNNARLLHITSYTPGEKAQTVTPRLKQVEDTEGLQSAPQGKDFKNAESFVLISGGNLIFCGNGIGLSKVEAYLKSLISSIYKDKTKVPNFGICAAANLKAIEMINLHGVKSIDLKCGIEQLALQQLPSSPTGWDRIKKSLADEFGALVEKDQTRDEQKAMEDMIANISFSLDGNTMAIKQSQVYLKDMAKKIINDDELDEFVIFTQKGEPIKASEIKVKDNRRVDTNGNYLESASVFTQLMEYLSDLKTDKII